MRTHFEDSVAQYVTASVNLSGPVDLSARILFQSTLWGLLMANVCMICGEFCCCSPLISSKTVVTRKQEDRGGNITRETPLANIKSNFLTCFHPVHGSNLFQKYSHLEWISVWIVDGSVAPPGTLDLAFLIAMPVWQRQQRWPKGVSVELHYLCLAFGDLSACITGEEFVIL